MQSRIGTRLMITVALAMGIFACSHLRRIQKSPDWRVKYDAALTYFGKKDYYRSAILLEEIQPIVRGLPEGEKVQFHLAYCQFYERTYLLSSNSFKVFYETYGRSSLAEEAQYMYAYSLYESSPPYNLDQTGTEEAMDAMQNFINRYPYSTFAEKGAEMITQCQLKLERKYFENAKLYLRLGYYEAASVTFDNFKNKFPDSKMLEEADYLRVRSQFLWARHSIHTKQKERYETALTNYKTFVDTYPQSAFLKNIESYYNSSLQHLHKLKSNPISYGS